MRDLQVHGNGIHRCICLLASSQRQTLGNKPDQELWTILNEAQTCVFAGKIQTNQKELVSSSTLGKHFLKW